MATRTTTALEDDLDGGPAEETIRFRLGAHEYEIDLNLRNADRFRAHMAPFVSYARRAGPGRQQRAVLRQNSADIRAWAKEHGIHVNNRGRIPADIVKQYEAVGTGH